MLSERDFKEGTEAVAQLAARGSHDPKVMSSIPTCRTVSKSWLMHGLSTPNQPEVVAAGRTVLPKIPSSSNDDVEGSCFLAPAGKWPIT